MFRNFFLFLSAILIFGNSQGQNIQYQFSHLNISNGLSHNQVTAIFKDSRGFMWFGTMTGLNRYDGSKFKTFKHSVRDSTAINDDFIEKISEGPERKLWVFTRKGLNIYDPATEKFNRNTEKYLKKFGLTSQGLTSILKDKNGDFWFVNTNLGVYHYNSRTQKTHHYYHKRNDKSSLISNAIACIAPDSKGDMWVIYSNAVIDRINPRTHKVTFRSYMLHAKYFTESVEHRLSIDKEDGLWIYNHAYDIGLYYIDATNLKELKHLSKNSPTGRLNSNLIYNVIQDNKGLIWIATDHGGINLLDKKDFKIKYLLNRTDDAKSVAQNSIVSMYKDDSGIVWIGTYKKGLSFYHQNIIKFPLIRHYTSDPNSLPFEDVNRFVEDARGNLWIGTNGGGLIYYNRKINRFTQYKHSFSNSNSLSNDVVVSLFIDHQQKLWIGTYFGGLDCFDGTTFTHYRHNKNNPNSISDDRVWEIFEDSERNLWVGTLAGGLNRFDRKTNIFHRYFKGTGNTVRSRYTSAILEDKEGNIWLGSSEGIDVLMKKTQKFVHYGHNDSDSNSLSHDNVSSMHLDSRGLIWIATRGGLCMLNPKTKKFRNFDKKDGLPDNVVMDIQEDKNHSLWLSTYNGLSHLVISKSKGTELEFNFTNYDETDGLQGLGFNENASYTTRKGELIFGGPSGFNIFLPENVRASTRVPSLVLTDFQVFNKSLRPGEEVNGDVILERSITESQSIQLKYSANVFSIEFAALNFFNTDKVKLQYMLKGFDKDWLTADQVRKATYTNLDPGHYTFKVRTVNKNNVYSEKELNLKIHVLPPFWRTPFAYMAYFLIFAGTLYSIRRRGIIKIKTQFALEQERQEAKNMHELDMMKIKFFTNVSHEFRTPLSLILAPVEKIIKQTEEPEQLRQLQMINRNARRLLNLVNQLLDFRKMEVQELKLHPKRGDIIKFVKEISFSFTDVADKKNIGFVFDSETESLEAQFDSDKIERILFNLLSNSFKFTQEGGHVSVLINLIERHPSKLRVLEIKVIDTGIGIPREKHDRVFDRFFQNDVPGTMVNQGSGIGLSITKEFVKLHGGEITVESEPGQGSCFIVTLPMKVYDSPPETLPEETKELKAPVPNAASKPSGKRQTVLLVEDNDDFRFYLKDNLKESFHIIEAVNGKEGWQKALALHPNIIVSDISMPEMDGIALCKKVKSDSRTAHLPVVLLTALTAEEQQLKGLETGASDYMTKPFNFEILLSKIKNILLQQESMRKTYQKQVEVRPSEITVESPDEIFIHKALQIIEKNISNPDFSVEELSGEMYMSRVTLYKKVLAITGKTPVEFIRSVRVKRAAQLLEKGHLTISQVGYKVGFKSQKYFVRSFKAEYNMLPSAYIEEARMQSLKD